MARCRGCTTRISLLTPKPPVGFVKSLSFQYGIAVIQTLARCSTPRVSTCQIQVNAHFVDPIKTNDARV